MKKVRLVWTLKQAEKHKAAISNKKIEGYFLWICDYGTVDRIVGYHFDRGFIADECYRTGNNWIIDLFRSIFSKKGSIHITRFI